MLYKYIIQTPPVKKVNYKLKTVESRGEDNKHFILIEPWLLKSVNYKISSYMHPEHKHGTYVTQKHMLSLHRDVLLPPTELLKNRSLNFLNFLIQ